MSNFLLHYRSSFVLSQSSKSIRLFIASRWGNKSQADDWRRIELLYVTIVKDGTHSPSSELGFTAALYHVKILFSQSVNIWQCLFLLHSASFCIF